MKRFGILVLTSLYLILLLVGTAAGWTVDSNKIVIDGNTITKSGGSTGHDVIFPVAIRQSPSYIEGWYGLSNWCSNNIQQVEPTVSHTALIHYPDDPNTTFTCGGNFPSWNSEEFSVPSVLYSPTPIFRNPDNGQYYKYLASILGQHAFNGNFCSTDTGIYTKTCSADSDCLPGYCSIFPFNAQYGMVGILFSNDGSDWTEYSRNPVLDDNTISALIKNRNINDNMTHSIVAFDMIYDNGKIRAFAVAPLHLATFCSIDTTIPCQLDNECPTGQVCNHTSVPFDQYAGTYTWLLESTDGINWNLIDEVSGSGITVHPSLPCGYCGSIQNGVFTSCCSTGCSCGGYPQPWLLNVRLAYDSNYYYMSRHDVDNYIQVFSARPSKAEVYRMSKSLFPYVTWEKLVEYGCNTSFPLVNNTRANEGSAFERDGFGGLIWYMSNDKAEFIVYTSGYGCDNAIEPDYHYERAVEVNITENIYTVTPSAGANGSISPNTPQIVFYGTTTEFNVTPNTGYHISEVSGCGGSPLGVLTTDASYIYTTGPITANCTVTATFSNTYTVSPYAGANGTISPNTLQNVNYNGTTSFMVAPDTNYHITSISGCGGVPVADLPNNTSYTYSTGPITEDCVVSASFSNTYKVKPIAGPGGSISPDTTQRVNYNTITSFTVTPSPGYHIASVTGCGGSLSGSIYTTGPITGDCTVTASFAINPSGITVTAPNGGESWQIGTTQTINWTYAGNPGSTVKIVLLKGGVSQGAIATSVPIGTNGSGSYAWAIPTTQTVASDYQIKVVSETDNTYKDTSDANFSITTPLQSSITVTSPNGGESWRRGTTQTISWTYAGNPGGYVKVVLYKNGVSQGAITTSTPIGTGGSGSYSWTIPSTQTLGADYEIKVVSTTDSTIKDFSDAYFSITN